MRGAYALLGRWLQCHGSSLYVARTVQIKLSKEDDLLIYSFIYDSKKSMFMNEICECEETFKIIKKPSHNIKAHHITFKVSKIPYFSLSNLSNLFKIVPIGSLNGSKLRNTRALRIYCYIVSWESLIWLRIASFDCKWSFQKQTGVLECCVTWTDQSRSVFVGVKPNACQCIHTGSQAEYKWQDPTA